MIYLSCKSDYFSICHPFLKGLNLNLKEFELRVAERGIENLFEERIFGYRLCTLLRILSNIMQLIGGYRVEFLSCHSVSVRIY